MVPEYLYFMPSANGPSIITYVLWPFCYKVAEGQYNKLDVDVELWSPLERLLGYKDEIAAEDFHTWGCPLYVLDSSLQTGTGIDPPKWDPCSKAGVYLGHSPHHTCNVALVLNLQTGHVSSQYHLVFDDGFTTVPYIDSAETPPNWATLVAEHSDRATNEAFSIASMWHEGEVAHTED
eukprot:1386382-Ditylum_brightwellii.AAC.1